MKTKDVKLIVLEHYSGNIEAIEIFAELATQCLRNRRVGAWTSPRNSDILKAPTVKS